MVRKAPQPCTNVLYTGTYCNRGIVLFILYFPESGELNSGLIDPIITLEVRAYDLGIPSLDSVVPVHIFTEEISSRTMRFIVSENWEKVEKDQDHIRSVQQKFVT